jgi:hypothetical protein
MLRLSPILPAEQLRTNQYLVGIAVLQSNVEAQAPSSVDACFHTTVQPLEDRLQLSAKFSILVYPQTVLELRSRIFSAIELDLVLPRLCVGFGGDKRLGCRSLRPVSRVLPIIHALISLNRVNQDSFRGGVSKWTGPRFDRMSS